MPANRRLPDAGVRVFQPMWGSRSACSRSTVPGQMPQPAASTPCSMPLANSTWCPTQMASTGLPAARRPAITAAPSTASSPSMQAAKAPTPGTTRPSAARAASASAVTVTRAPLAATARSAERMLPEP